MIDIVWVVVAMTPVGKARSRSTRSGRHYTPAATVAAERAIADAFISAYPGFTPHDGPVALSVVAEFVPPVSWPKWKRTLALLNLWRHTSRPDCSNVQKLVEDALNGCLYADDSAIFDARTRKLYASAGRIAVTATLYPRPPQTSLGLS